MKNISMILSCLTSLKLNLIWITPNLTYLEVIRAFKLHSILLFVQSVKIAFIAKDQEVPLFIALTAIVRNMFKYESEK